ncbi:winged helix-turn-helix transcriptional regulator [Mycobacterium sp. Aquia_213]|uniref:winged helix-turn-helix transcriptional regulator n=1 Tax=Mycobacterium sp. Aquia_213 TaxID=2991728 RepID=UPI0022701075|nr:helix-turn-helix domain-containing protein [Mycobacterium sp. Aquia_213]WAC90644.1 helix-turn-helix domain-containing protein [Mycobacterium sp. Aquia_213]
MRTRNYNQNCPIARGLDILGERWTLLILRELVGGARRYGDLRAELPGIATNLLAERLKELQDAGLVDRTDLPAPIGRTVYTLSDLGWQRVLPVIQGIAWFGVDLLDPIDDGPVTPLNGFLAGILLGFDSGKAAGLEATCRAEIDGRRFDFVVTQGRLAGAHADPVVTITAAAADLVNARLNRSDAKRKAALRRVAVTGDPAAVDAVRAAFSL